VGKMKKMVRMTALSLTLFVMLAVFMSGVPAGLVFAEDEIDQEMATIDDQNTSSDNTITEIEYYFGEETEDNENSGIEFLEEISVTTQAEETENEVDTVIQNNDTEESQDEQQGDISVASEFETESDVSTVKTLEKDDNSERLTVNAIDIYHNITIDNGDGTYTAWFGYENSNDYIIYDDGSAQDMIILNAVSSTPDLVTEYTLLTEFLPGVNDYAFKVDFGYVENRSRPFECWVDWELQVEGMETDTARALCCDAIEQPYEDIIPSIQGITDNGDGTFTAYFNYENKNSIAIPAVALLQNIVTGESVTGEVLTEFQPGFQLEAFSVVYSGTEISWAIQVPGGEVQIASAIRKPDQDINVFLDYVKDNGDNTYTAVFGYINLNSRTITADEVLINSIKTVNAEIISKDLVTEFKQGSSIESGDAAYGDKLIVTFSVETGKEFGTVSWVLKGPNEITHTVTASVSVASTYVVQTTPNESGETVILTKEVVNNNSDEGLVIQTVETLSNEEETEPDTTESVVESDTEEDETEVIEDSTIPEDNGNSGQEEVINMLKAYWWILLLILIISIVSAVIIIKNNRDKTQGNT
jgi:hypothetical protein